MKNVQKILCPVDFSKTAINAYNYAKAFAKVFDAQITLLYAYRPVSDTSQPVTLIAPAANSADQAKTFFKEFLEEQGTDGVEVESRIELGFASDVIDELSEEYDFVIMGTRKEHNWLERIFGTVSSAAMRLSGCPVLVVSEEDTFRPIDDIVYATNFDDDDLQAMVDITELAFALKANVHIVHVEVDEQADFEAIREKVEEMDLRDDVRVEFASITVKSKSVRSGLEQYAAGNSIDLIVMLKQRRSLFERLFRKSQTRDLSHQSKAPVLVLHEPEE